MKTRKFWIFKIDTHENCYLQTLNLYLQYCRENDHQTLLRLCEQESNNNEIGNIQFDDSFAEKV